MPGAFSHILRERKPKDLSELAILAEQYLDAHANRNKDWSKKPGFRDQHAGDKKIKKVEEEMTEM